MPDSASNYRWVILGLCSLLMFVMGAINFSVPFILGLVIKDLNLTYAQGGLVFGTLYLGFIFSGLLGGIASDRLGIRKAVAIATMVQAVAAMLRGFSVGFLDLFFYSLVVSVGAVMQTAGIARAIKEWFPAKELGTANGVWNVGFAIGAIVVSALTQTVILPIMNGWRATLLLYGALALVAGIIWIGFSKRPPATTPVTKGAEQSFVSGFLRVTRSKNIWLLFIIFGLVTGSQNATIAWMPTMLGLRGVSIEVVGLVGAIVWVGAMIGSIGLPLLSDRIGLRKPIVICASPFLAIAIYTVGTSSGDLLELAAFLLGATAAYIWPIALTTVAELPEVSDDLIASGAGFMLTANGLGSFLFPTLGGYLRDITGSFTAGISVFWIAALLVIPAVALVRETGTRARRT